MSRIPLEDSLLEVEGFIKSIRKLLKKADKELGLIDEDADKDLLKTIDRLKARELQALRLFTTIRHNQQMMTVRFLDSPEWVSLSSSLIAAIADAPPAVRKKIRKVLIDHNALNAQVDEI